MRISGSKHLKHVAGLDVFPHSAELSWGAAVGRRLLDPQLQPGRRPVGRKGQRAALGPRPFGEPRGAALCLPVANRRVFVFPPWGPLPPVRAEASRSRRPAAPPPCARPPPGAAARPRAPSPRARPPPAAAPSSAAPPPGSASTRRGGSAKPRRPERPAPRPHAAQPLYLRRLRRQRRPARALGERCRRHFPAPPPVRGPRPAPRPDRLPAKPLRRTACLRGRAAGDASERARLRPARQSPGCSENLATGQCHPLLSLPRNL